MNYSKGFNNNNMYPYNPYGYDKMHMPVMGMTCMNGMPYMNEFSYMQNTPNRTPNQVPMMNPNMPGMPFMNPNMPRMPIIPPMDMPGMPFIPPMDMPGMPFIPDSEMPELPEDFMPDGDMPALPAMPGMPQNNLNNMMGPGISMPMNCQQLMELARAMGCMENMNGTEPNTETE